MKLLVMLLSVSGGRLVLAVIMLSSASARADVDGVDGRERDQLIDHLNFGEAGLLSSDVLRALRVLDVSLPTDEPTFELPHNSAIFQVGQHVEVSVFDPVAFKEIVTRGVVVKAHVPLFRPGLMQRVGADRIYVLHAHNRQPRLLKSSHDAGRVHPIRSGR